MMYNKCALNQFVQVFFFYTDQCPIYSKCKKQTTEPRTDMVIRSSEKAALVYSLVAIGDWVILELVLLSCCEGGRGGIGLPAWFPVTNTYTN